MKSEPMRVLHVMNHVRNCGNGIVNTAVDIACVQVRRGAVVAVAAEGGDEEELLTRYGVGFFEFNQRRRPLNILRAARRFRQIVKEFDPDIVHCHMMTGMVLAWALRGTSRYKLVSHIQNVYQRSSILMGLAGRVITVSQSVADLMAAQGLPRHKLRVVQNSTIGSPRLPALTACAPAQLQQPAIVTVGGMFYRKGIGELIAAFAQIADRFPAAHLYLVGEGSDRAVFEAQATASPVTERIHFEGFQKNPMPYLRAAHTFVLASRRESFPLVLIEARQAGCAIVTTDVDGNAEAVDYGAAGSLVPPQDPRALAAALETLLTDAAAHQQLQQGAQQNLERFTVERLTERVDEVYQELLGQRATAPQALGYGKVGAQV